VRGNGIQLWRSREVVIEGNRIEGHRDGIYFEFSTAAVVRGNTVTGNQRYGLHFMRSDSCSYERNAFAGNGAGAAVMYSRWVAMRENRFERNWGSAAYGLLLKEISDGEIRDNRFLQNTVALYLDDSNRNTIAGNRFENNGWGVRLLASASDNRFEGNSFRANAFDVVTNSRSSHSTFRANWWDRYRGYDLDRDGHGDVPFRPVRLFGLIVEHTSPALLLLRSPFVDLLDTAERILPMLTPETLADPAPLMRDPAR
jgi:nitrous oxidase accessory protein